ncbi:MAG: tRNA (N6-isopentenyl adenosine(37)-C2)-methylthiotransferase MiaB [Culicoidibacterales bacterium]
MKAMETKKDYSQYFTGTAPSLKDAKKRTKNAPRVITDAFEIPTDMIQAGVGKTFFIRTYGCQMNEHDEEVMAGIFEQMGYTRTKKMELADVVLLNTCAVRENAENKVFGELGHLKKLKRERPELLLGVCGCMTQEEDIINRILQKEQHVDFIFGTHNIHRIPQIVRDAFLAKELVVEVWSKEGDIIENLPKTRNGNLKAWVNIAYGCDKFCTYCIIPYTRGKERSRQPEDILAEVRELAELGYQEVTLLGQNVNSYGKDLGINYTFASLLADVQKMSIPRVRFTTSHPWDFTDEMVATLASGGNLMPHVHLPVQAGSSAVLKLMGRQYNKVSYTELYNKIRTQIPGVAITTDIIVGFPNETDEQFAETLQLCKELKYDGAFNFIYSPREGTPAAKMIDNIDESTKKTRLKELNVVLNEHALTHNQAYIDTVQYVLVEGTSQKNDEILSGYTESLKLVNFEGPTSLIGQIVPVKITQARTWSLFGAYEGE